MSINTVEILAPAGGPQQLAAAVRCGADAVYLGTGSFNARRNAENFGSENSLEDAVAYCHSRGVRVHVTVNTLLTDRELPDFEKEIEKIASSGVDAVIVQDLAAAHIIRECCPSLEMHASTQMAVHNAAGCSVLEKLGFRRVILARELTLEEIREVCRNTSLQVEVFVHGALCVGASGLCLLSSMIGGRSGNRGLCAQPCRLDFACGRTHNALSLKDMSHIEALPELIAAGVKSVKIEGRMKRPEYVAAAVTACRKVLDGKEPDLQSLKAVFSRSGFTDGYLRGRRDASMFGSRTKEDVEAAQPILKQLSGLYKDELRSQNVDMTLDVSRGRPVLLTVSDGNHSIRVTGPMSEASVNVDMDPETARKSLERMGGTQYRLRDLTTHIERGSTVRLSELNRMRREALDRLDTARSVPLPAPFTPSAVVVSPHEAAPDPMVRLRFEHPGQLFDVPWEAQIVLPHRAILAEPELVRRFGSRLTAELPAICFPLGEAGLARDLAALSDLGITDVYADTLGTAGAALKAGMKVHGGVGLNILNGISAEELAALKLTDFTVSPEISMEQLKDLGGSLPRALVAYGYLPLMKFRACPGSHLGECSKCSGSFELKDRKGETFRVLCRSKAYSELLNCVPLYVNRGTIPGADIHTLWFTVETPGQCRHITGLFMNGEDADFRRTRGLYFRKLL